MTKLENNAPNPTADRTGDRDRAEGASANAPTPDSHAIDSHAIDSHAIDSHAIDSHVIDSHAIDSHAIDSHTNNSHTLAPPTLGSVVAIWVIFAPTAACAGYALYTWASINRTRLNAIYAISLALFFAALFGSLLFGMTRRYVRGRRSPHSKQSLQPSEPRP